MDVRTPKICLPRNYAILFLVNIFVLTRGQSCSSGTYVQQCKNCRGNHELNNKGTLDPASEAECIAALDEPDVNEVHYNPSNSKCPRYTNTENVYFDEAETRSWYRHTTIADCRIFTLTRQQDRKIIASNEVSSSKLIGKCYADCFNTIGCYMFVYDEGSSTCKTYVGANCGTSCTTAMANNGNMWVYTRNCEGVCPALTSTSTYTATMPCGRSPGDTAYYECMVGYEMSSGSPTTTCQVDNTWTDNPPTCTPINCGNPPFPTGATSLTPPPFTTYLAVATYSCSTGYYMASSNTLFCQADGTWNSTTAPVCNLVDCGMPPSAPADGSRSYTSTVYGATVQYFCNTGYTLTGLNSITCQVSGSWSSAAPVCNPVNCGPPPPVLSFGTVSTTTSFYNGVANYSCITGYSLYGTSTFICQADGTWSGTVAPTCNITSCDSPPAAPGNGSVVTSSVLYQGVTTYDCNEGYLLAGDNVIVCQADGSWNTSVPTTCTIVDCYSPLPAPNFGLLDVSFTTFGEIAMYTCSAGYSLSGDSIIVCQANASWNNSVPTTCTLVDCNSPPSAPNFGSVDVSSTLFGGIATYSCSVGYSLTGDNVIVCQENGFWNNSVSATCTLIDCNSPPAAPMSGSVNVSSTTLGGVAVYNCSVGYTLSGTSTLICQADFMWSSLVAPNCTIVNCGDPPVAPTLGWVNVLSTTYESVATYNCTTGYILTGTSSVECQAGGTWTSSVSPTCMGVDCGPPPNASVFGSIDTSMGTRHPNWVLYSCNNGYILNGSSSITCQANATWSSSVSPTCDPVSCGVLADPSNGNVSTPNGPVFPHSAYYECFYGYALNGNTQRTCENTGAWSGTVPTCIYIDCGTLTSPANGNVYTPFGASFEQEAIYNCTVGYILNGDNLRTCLYNSTWSGSDPTCIIANCNRPATLLNGTVTVSAFTYGNNATYVCDTGFVLTGSSVIYCDATEVWNPSPPSCELVDCGPLTPPINGQVFLASGTTYGSTAYFTCDTGYYLSHVNNRSCHISGSWTFTTPQCVPNGVVVTTPAPSVIYLMPCLCLTNSTFASMTQSEIIAMLIQDTAIATNATSLSIYKLKSRSDPRMSSKIVGLIGAILMAAIFGLMLLLDLLTLCKHCSDLRDRDS